MRLRWPVRRSSAPERYLLCRPHGGLNDTLNLVAVCWDHAEQHQRYFVVDGSRSHFCRHFSAVFEPLEPTRRVRFAPTARLYRAMNRTTCDPAMRTGRVDASPTTIRPRPGYSPLEWMDVVDVRTGALVAVDLAVASPAGVLVVEAFRGGQESIDLLRRVRLTAPIAKRVRARLSTLPPAYVGVHLRHSDIRADVPAFLGALRDRLAGETVLVCSDDREVPATATALLDRSVVITSSDVPTSGGTPYQLPFLDAGAEDQLVIDTLVDLFALAAARELHIAPIVNRADPSGFSLLARNLAGDKSLQDQLLRITNR